MNIPKPLAPVAKPLAVATALLACGSAQATLLFEDGFNYPVGSLNASSVSPSGLSGNAWSSGNSHITVSSPNLSYNGMTDLGGNAVQTVWGTGSAGTVVNTYTPVTTGNIYYSFLLNCTVAPNSATYLTSLNPGTASPNGSTDALQVNVGVNAGGFQLGVRTAGASAALSSTVLSLNTTYFVVAEYSFGSQTASLYINPTPGDAQPGSASATTGVGNGTVTSIADLGFKAQSAPTGTFLIDNTRVGTTWEDVTPSAVPEPSTFAIAGLAALGLAWNFRRLRR